MSDEVIDEGQPDPSPYKGLYGIARESLWLSNADIPHDADTLVTIEQVNRRNNARLGGTVKKVVLSLKFVNRNRELVITPTIYSVLSSLFGLPLDKWWGKRIYLFVEQDVKLPKGKKGPAVRIRAQRVTETESKQ